MARRLMDSTKKAHSSVPASSLFATSQKIKSGKYIEGNTTHFQFVAGVKAKIADLLKRLKLNYRIALNNEKYVLFNEGRRICRKG